MRSDPTPATDVAALRRDYMLKGLLEADLDPDPFVQFEAWMKDAISCAAIREPNAMVLATVSADGLPHARFVLLKGVSPEGFVFYTNQTSAKARELETFPRAALAIGWLELERQVRIEGPVSLAPREAVEAYFQSRPRGSRLGAWASPQSEIIAGREVLDQRLAEAEARFSKDAPVPTPEFWGGYCVAPEQIEFWQGRTNRLHDRLRYRHDADSWKIERLGP